MNSNCTYIYYVLIVKHYTNHNKYLHIHTVPLHLKRTIKKTIFGNLINFKIKTIKLSFIYYETKQSLNYDVKNLY